jgi:hypothetical protein
MRNELKFGFVFMDSLLSLRRILSPQYGKALYCRAQGRPDGGVELLIRPTEVTIYSTGKQDVKFEISTGRIYTRCS